MAPPPVVAAPAEPPREQPRGVFSLGGLYGFNLRDEGSDLGDDKTSHLAGVNLGFDYAFTDFTSLSLEQAGFFNFGTEEDGFGGRSAAGLNFFPGFLDIIPYVGANIGYLGTVNLTAEDREGWNAADPTRQLRHR